MNATFPTMLNLDVVQKTCVGKEFWEGSFNGSDSTERNIIFTPFFFFFIRLEIQMW